MLSLPKYRPSSSSCVQKYDRASYIDSAMPPTQTTSHPKRSAVSAAIASAIGSYFAPKIVRIAYSELCLACFWSKSD